MMNIFGLLMFALVASSYNIIRYYKYDSFIRKNKLIKLLYYSIVIILAIFAISLFWDDSMFQFSNLPFAIMLIIFIESSMLWEK